MAHEIQRPLSPIEEIILNKTPASYVGYISIAIENLLKKIEQRHV